MKMSLNFSKCEKNILGVIRKVFSIVFYFLYLWLSSAVLGLSCIALYYGNNESIIGRYYLISAVYVVIYSLIRILSKKKE